MADAMHGVTARERLEALGKLQGDTVAAKVDGRVYDLHTPIPEDAREIEPIRVNDPEALPIIRHSTAHVMADAVQRLFPGTKVAFGPAIDDGFYYDYDRPDGSFTEEDLEKITEVMLGIIEANT